LVGIAFLILGTVLGLLFAALTELAFLCLAFGALLSIRLLRGLTISGWFLVNLSMVGVGLGFLVYGMWSIWNFEINGGVGSYAWYLAQVNVLVGMFSLAMPFIFRTGAKTL
jgi:hypothetical protein